MIAFDALEQVDAEPLELIGADAGRDGRAGFIEIGLDLRLAQSPHRHARNGNGFEQDLAVARNGNGGVKLMAVAGQGVAIDRRPGRDRRALRKAVVPSASV